MRRPASLSLLAVGLISIFLLPSASLARRADDGAAPRMPHPRMLRSPAGRAASLPRLVTTGDGALLMSWMESEVVGGAKTPVDRTGLPPRRWSLRLAALRGEKWSPVLTVEQSDSFVVNWADFPAVSAFGAHGLAVAWPWKSGPDGSRTETRIAISADGGGEWTRPIVLHDDREGAEHGFTSLIAQGDGVRAAWLDGNNLKDGVEEGMADMTLHSRFISSKGVRGRGQEIDGRTCDCCPTASVMVGDEVLVAYRDRSPDEIRDIAVTRLDNGRWSAPAIVHDDGWKIMGCPVNGPALAAAGKTVAIAWYTAAQDTPRVYVAFSADGGRRFGEPIRVDEGRPMGRVGVAMAGEGLAAVSWLEGEARDMRIRARFVREGLRPGDAATIARIPGGRANQVPQLMHDGSRLVLAWTEPGTPSQVRVAEVKIPSR